MKHPIIRDAVAADVPTIMELLRLLADFDGCPDAFAARPDLLRDAWFSDSRKTFALVAEVDGQLVGIATY